MPIDGISEHNKHIKTVIEYCAELTKSISDLKIPGLCVRGPCSQTALRCFVCIPYNENPPVVKINRTELQFDVLLLDARKLSRDAEFSMVFKQMDTHLLNSDLKRKISELDRGLSDLKSARRCAYTFADYMPTIGQINSMVTQLDMVLADTRELLSLMHLVAPTDTEIDVGLDADKVHAYVAGILADPLVGYAAKSAAKSIQVGF